MSDWKLACQMMVELSVLSVERLVGKLAQSVEMLGWKLVYQKWVELSVQSVGKLAGKLGLSVAMLWCWIFVCQMLVATL
jgi:hypothetical protein